MPGISSIRVSFLWSFFLLCLSVLLFYKLWPISIGQMCQCPNKIFILSDGNFLYINYWSRMLRLITFEMCLLYNNRVTKLLLWFIHYSSFCRWGNIKSALMKLVAYILLFTAIFLVNESKESFSIKFLLYFIFFPLDLADSRTDFKCYFCPAGDEICDAKKTNFTPKVKLLIIFWVLFEIFFEQICTEKSEIGEKLKCFKKEKAGKISRGCAVEKPEKRFCDEEMKKDKDLICNVCKRELCNAVGKNFAMEKFYIGLIALGSAMLMRIL